MWNETFYCDGPMLGTFDGTGSERANYADLIKVKTLNNLTARAAQLLYLPG